MTTDIHHPEGATSAGAPRLIGLDVTRAIALIGVVMMNYHGFLNDPATGNGRWSRFFHVFTGPLSTRFAATFVLVAGIGTALLAAGTLNKMPGTSHGTLRLRLARRGTVLIVGGYFLNMAWPGTILFFYGAYFLLSALIITLRTRYIAVVGALSATAAVALALWESSRRSAGHSTAWLHPYEIHSAQDLLCRIFLSYTHPVFPWFAFFCMGIILGRNLRKLRHFRIQLTVVCVTMLICTYGLATILNSTGQRDNRVIFVLTAMDPFSRGLFYILSTASVAVLAFLIINQMAEKYASSKLVMTLRRSGQMTLTLYLAHVLVFYILVKWSDLIGATGLDTSLTFAICFWIFGISAASLWHHHFGRGPIERLYRLIGG